jgi:hypothetical protein
MVRAFEWRASREGEEQFDVFVTTDQQLRYQQNLERRRIAIVILPYANWIKLKPRAETIAETISAMQPGSYLELELT